MCKSSDKFLVAGFGSQKSKKELILYGREDGEYQILDVIEMDDVVHGLDFEHMGEKLGWGGRGGGVMEIVA
jgi:hypothetical protein